MCGLCAAPGVMGLVLGSTVGGNGTGEMGGITPLAPTPAMTPPGVVPMTPGAVTMTLPPDPGAVTMTPVPPPGFVLLTKGAGLRWGSAGEEKGAPDGGPGLA